jgi:hypothetical protein
VLVSGQGAVDPAPAPATDAAAAPLPPGS